MIFSTLLPSLHRILHEWGRKSVWCQGSWLRGQFNSIQQNIASMFLCLFVNSCHMLHNTLYRTAGTFLNTEGWLTGLISWNMSWHRKLTFHLCSPHVICLSALPSTQVSPPIVAQWTHPCCHLELISFSVRVSVIPFPFRLAGTAWPGALSWTRPMAWGETSTWTWSVWRKKGMPR